MPSVRLVVFGGDAFGQPVALLGRQPMRVGRLLREEPEHHEAEPDPALIKKKLVLEVSAPVWARYRRKRTELDKESGERLSDDDLLDQADDATTAATESADSLTAAAGALAAFLDGAETAASDTSGPAGLPASITRVNAAGSAFET